MDLTSRAKWAEYSKAKDDMFHYTDTTHFTLVCSQCGLQEEDTAQLHSAFIEQNSHMSGSPSRPIKLPKIKKDADYERPPIYEQTFVPEIY
jgi:hypothetical protein